MRSPLGDHNGLTHLPSLMRIGSPPLTGMRKSASPLPSWPPAMIDVPSADQSTLPCPAAPSISIEGASRRALVPSADMIESWRFPARRIVAATMVPLGAIAGGSAITPLILRHTSEGVPPSTFHKPSPEPRADRRNNDRPEKR